MPTAKLTLVQIERKFRNLDNTERAVRRRYGESAVSWKDHRRGIPPSPDLPGEPVTGPGTARPTPRQANECKVEPSKEAVGRSKLFVRNQLDSFGDHLQQHLSKSVGFGVSHVQSNIQRALQKAALVRASTTEDDDAEDADDSLNETQRRQEQDQPFDELFPNACVIQSDGRFAALFSHFEPVNIADPTVYPGRRRSSIKELAYINPNARRTSIESPNDAAGDVDDPTLMFTANTLAGNKRNKTDPPPNPFANPSPVVRRPLSALPPKQRPTTATAPSPQKGVAAPARTTRSASRITARSNSTAAAGPPPPFWSSSQTTSRTARFTRPSTAIQRPTSASRTSAGSTSAPLPSRLENPIVHEKQFYFLHVKVHHGKQLLRDWVFDVVVSDVTDNDNVKSHTFRDLRLSENMSVVFHPPGNFILSPVDDIPWVRTVENLFGHTLHIAVFATYPRRTQVVDTYVHYGESTPSVAGRRIGPKV